MTAPALMQQLLDSPQLIEHVAELNGLMAAEHQRRLKFHEEVGEDGHWEFINGQVVVHSPARNEIGRAHV